MRTAHNPIFLSRSDRTGSVRKCNSVIQLARQNIKRNKETIDLFHNIFTLAVSSPNTVNWLMSYIKQLPVVKQHYKNIAAIQNAGGLPHI